MHAILSHPLGWSRPLARLLDALSMFGVATGIVALAAFLLDMDFAWVAHTNAGTTPQAYGGTWRDAALFGMTSFAVSIWMGLPLVAASWIGTRIVSGIPVLIAGLALAGALGTLGYIVTVGPVGSEAESLAGLAVTLFPIYQLCFFAGLLPLAWGVGWVGGRWSRRSAR
jgi:hypothetical protein